MYNGDSNANVKTQIGFATIILHVLNTFWSLNDYDVKLSDATFYGGCTHDVQFFYYFLN